jgi:hypothetical protein
MDALDHLQNDSILLAQEVSNIDPPNSLNNTTMNSTLTESFVKMIDEPSFIGGELQEESVNTAAKGMPAVQSNNTDKSTVNNEGEIVDNLENLKETLFSLDLFIHEIAYEKPSSFPEAELRLIFKFLDFPPVRISPTIMQTSPQQNDINNNSVDDTSSSNNNNNNNNKRAGKVNLGKSCLFRSSYASLKARCSQVPLYMMLVLEDSNSGIDHFIGSAAVNIYQYVDSIESGYLNIPLKNDGYVTGAYALYSLIGHETSKVTISLRVKDFGVHMLNHFICMHGKKKGTQQQQAIESTPLSSNAISPSRPIVHLVSPRASSVVLRASQNTQASTSSIFKSGQEEEEEDEDESNEFGVEDGSISTNPTSEQWELGKDEYSDLMKEGNIDKSKDQDTLVERALSLMQPRAGNISISKGEVENMFQPSTSHHSAMLPSGLITENELPPALLYTHIGPDSDKEEDDHIRNSEHKSRAVKEVMSPPKTSRTNRPGSSGLKIKSRRPDINRSTRNISPRNAQSARRLYSNRKKSPNGSVSSPLARNNRSDGKLSAADRRKREKQLKEMWSGKMKQGKAYDGRGE